MRATILALAIALPAVAADSVDLGAVNRIKSEAFEHSQVMDTLELLTDRYGPRLTASPEFKEAADWAAARLKEYGIENVHLEQWGPFGRSWSLEKFALEMTQPRYSLLSAWPLAWTANTKGTVTGEPIFAPLAGSQSVGRAEANLNEYIQKNKGKLRGKVVLISEPLRNIADAESRPDLRRYTDAELTELAIAPVPVPRMRIDPNNLTPPEDLEDRLRFNASLPPDVQDRMRERRQAVTAKRNKFFLDEGVLAVVQDDRRARDGIDFAEAAGSQEASSPLAPPMFVVTSEQYNRIVRLLENKTKVEMQVLLQAHASEGNAPVYNIVGEIPGTGPHKDELIMVGAHFDSWHSGTGATDNAAGSSVMIEVMRILKALNLNLDRTVRIALWSGEEQGLLGSKAYIKEHFGDPKTMKLTAAHAKLSGYFNLDNGSGKIRGVYLQGNDAMRPLFQEWLAPFRDQGVSTITIRNTSGTDHLSFDAVGLPGFQFIQDPLDYSSVTHHSDMDTYDHAIAGDLMQASAVIASVVYDAANRTEMLPRKPLPKPQETSAATR
ncbi:MAG TPA: M20/M25/M40 family metallo-hydrolase [Bryobacteraceae bacterium]|nr:M20/M25/M40 family metallo-hydrolase [Bryobacteraceae bacterium]